MRTKKQTRKLLKNYLDWWIRWLGLRWQHIVVEYVDSWESDLSCDAICDARWQYADSKLTFNLNHIQTMRKEDIEITVVHELMHVFLNEMREEGIKHEEHVATMLQKAFMWVKGADK